MESKKLTSNFIWRLLERFGAQGITFAVSLILARLLNPSVYGLIAIVTVFTSILQVFVESGLGTALIQKKDADDLDFSSVFWFNVTVSFILYWLLFFTAPLIASFYNMPDLKPVIRVMSLLLIISGVKNIQQAYISRKMQFKTFFVATLGGTLAAAAIGIIMALKGFGVWALVAQNLVNQAIDTIILWIMVKWRPQLIFSSKRLRSLLGYGWKLFVSAIIDTVYNDLRQLVIGKIYTSSELAYYNQGNKLPSYVMTAINASIDSVLLPALSSEQDNIDRVRSMTRRSIKISTYLMMPMMVGLGVCADTFVRLVLTEKWLPCVFYLRIFCFAYAFYPIHTANLNAIKAVGRSDVFLKLEIVKKTIDLAILVSTMFISVKAMAIGVLVTTVTSQIVNAWPNRKLLGYGYGEQVKDMLPQIIISCLMGLAVYSMSYIQLPDLLLLIIQILTGVILYVVLSIMFKIDTFKYICNIIKHFVK